MLRWILRIGSFGQHCALRMQLRQSRVLEPIQEVVESGESVVILLSA
jgi:hypothetical protein